jgi:triacylglycerol lipase
MLVHGFFGWGEARWFDYFYGIPELLHREGYRVFVAELDAINSSEVRSAQLLTQLEEALACACEPQAHLIAHSQGGIDARFLIGPHQRADLVASITTVASPHRGFELAELGARGEGLGFTFLQGLTGLLSELIRSEPDQPHDLQATLRSMSVSEREAYHRAWPDPPHVPIYSYAGFTNRLSPAPQLCSEGSLLPPPRHGDWIEPLLITSYGLLGGPFTANDGVVPTASCVWGEFLGCIPADHFDQIGQLSGVTDFDFEAFYLNHARFLEGRGR